MTKLNPPKRLLLVALAGFLHGAVLAQVIPSDSGERTTSEPRLAVILETKSGRQQFHFGELIDLKLQYVSAQYGRYVRVNGEPLDQGHAWRWQCLCLWMRL